MAQIPCLRCRNPIDSSVESCPHCGERVTAFQRTYSERLIDGKYEILERLGMGGMGEIFKVRHIHLNEQRVIKVMRANIASDEQALQRFLHEARTSTMIKHRNLAMLYDFSTLEDGSYYMVWEYIEGTNVQKWIAKNGPVPPRLALEISIQALEGLDHLHGMGLIHRDISPENIMLSQDRQGKLLAKVIDFGIAKQLQEGEGGQGLTQTGMFLGKLKYASPEQAGFMKEGDRLDSRSDLYSFGVVMYEMLAGRAPFQASNPHSYILKHATERPLPISVTNPEVQVPASLEAEVFRALEKDRDDRPATAAEFASRLEALRAEIPPDEKFGIGDWRGTVTKEPTLIDPTRRGGTRVAPASGAADQPTLITGPAAAAEREERAPFEPTLRGGTVVAGEAAEPTLLEPRTVPGGAAPTLIEKPSLVGARPPRSRGLTIAIGSGIAAIIVIAVLTFVLRGRKPVPPATATTAPPVASTQAPVLTPTETAALPPVVAPQLAGTLEGEIVLIATPYGHVERLMNKSTRADVELAENDRWTPARIRLPAGEYQLVVTSPDGAQSRTLDVTLLAGKQSRPVVRFGKPNLDALSEEFLKP